MNELNDRPLAPASPPSQDPPTSSMPAAVVAPGPTEPPSPPNTPWYTTPQPRRDRNGALVLGVVLVVVGAWLLLRQFFPIFELGQFWPLILVGIGVFFVISAFWRRSA